MERLKQYNWLVTAFLTLFLMACVSVEAPKNFDERLAYGYASVAASRTTAASMLERGRIDVETAKKAQTMADQSRAALDLARATQLKGDMKTAQGQLDLALTVLTSMEAFLKEKEAK